MKKFPDHIVILKVNGNSPYETPTREQVYTGRCRAFLDRQAGFRMDRVMNSTYRVVIPNRTMPEIGENFVTAVKFHNNPKNEYWDVVGYVKDFARYERNCEIIFELVKENAIFEDIPGPTLEQGKDRKLVIEEDDWLHIESAGMIDNGFIADEPVHIIQKKNTWIDPATGESLAAILELRWWGPDPDNPLSTGKWYTLPDKNANVIEPNTIAYKANEDKENHVVFVPRFHKNAHPTSPLDEDKNRIHICLVHPDPNGGDPITFYDKSYAIFEQNY